MENDKIILRSYNRAWKYPRKIYAIDRIRLLVPINIDDAAYFAAGLLITMLLLRIFPFLNHIPFAFRYILLPYGLMKFLTKKKFDGKPAHKFLIGYAEYLMLPKTFSRFEPCVQYKKGRFGSVAYRGKEIVNLMEQLTRVKGRGKRKRDV